MPQNRSYEEAEAKTKEKDSPLAEFVVGFLMGALGLPMTIGWSTTTFTIGFGIGFYIGGNMGWSSLKRKREKGTI